eukprot:COSAG04_NODE_1796_length_5560_cov_13.581029_4_plen_205_part_00
MTEPRSIIQIRPPNRPLTFSGPETVEQYLAQVCLSAWRPHCQAHLPENCKSVALVRATTTADLRHMARQTNFSLDDKTIQQVLKALDKPTTHLSLAMMTIVRLGGTAARRADRASVACLLPRHAVESSGGVFGRRRIVRNRAAPVSATIAAAPRRGSASAIALRFILTVVRELDVETSAATELACCGFAAGSHITHVQNCANLA